MYKYKLNEQEDKVKKFHEERIMAFDALEARLEDVKKSLRQAKIETIKYYRENPKSYAVDKPTDLIGDYIKDIETLLNTEE
jgi:hypothetical protein